MPILYDVVFLLYSLFYIPYLLLTKRWHGDYAQRFGIFPENLRLKLHQSENIWVHAVSVGEVIAVEGFIRRLKERSPKLNIVCSVTTKTGYELAHQRLANTACVIAAPLDFSFTVRAFVRLLRPKLYIAAETEIWPNLFERLRRENVPIAIINGRISDRSFGRYQLIKGLLKGILNNVSAFAMQSELDAQRIVDLGADKSRVQAVGNIKFDDIDSRVRGNDSGMGFGNDKFIWIAGSTHPGEEDIVLEVFKKLKPSYPDWQLMIAPRHVERTAEVMALVEKAGLKGALFSKLDSRFRGNDSVIIVDTIGDLRRLYSFAALVFVGKSLCIGGGHNIIEPAFFAKPIIIGPRMENFRDITACFKTEDAIAQVQDAAEFESAVKDLMADQQKREALGKSARRVIDKNQGATERALKLIEQWL